MRSFKKDAKIFLLVLIAALLISQVIRVERTNPSVFLDSAIDPSVKPILKRACYDCHSNETVWPWYSKVAPVSWLVGSDVNEGRRELNFSNWQNFPVDVKERQLKKIAEEVEDSGMPPWYYLIMHRHSSLTQQERDKIKSWTADAEGSD